MTLENCELEEEEETASVEVVDLFGLYLDHETASFHVFQTFWKWNSISFKTEGLKLLFVK